MRQENGLTYDNRDLAECLKSSDARVEAMKRRIAELEEENRRLQHQLGESNKDGRG